MKLRGECADIFPMDMVSASVGMRQSQQMSQVQYAVAKKMMQNDQMQGAAAVKLIQAASANANRAIQAGDALVAQATGLGGKCDICA
jgi:hypothetical protein